MANVVYEQYRRDAIRKRRVFEITKTEFMRLVAQPCAYCGRAPFTVAARVTANGVFTYNGLDRVDSSSGYTLENVVTCCRPCNDMKGTLDYAEFIAQCERIANYWEKAHGTGMDRLEDHADVSGVRVGRGVAAVVPA